MYRETIALCPGCSAERPPADGPFWCARCGGASVPREHVLWLLARLDARDAIDTLALDWRDDRAWFSRAHLTALASATEPSHPELPSGMVPTFGLLSVGPEVVAFLALLAEILLIALWATAGGLAPALPVVVVAALAVMSLVAERDARAYRGRVFDRPDQITTIDVRRVAYKPRVRSPLAEARLELLVHFTDGDPLLIVMPWDTDADHALAQLAAYRRDVLAHRSTCLAIQLARALDALR
jgi:hypothetical protein